jgi:hypothetical protein
VFILLQSAQGRISHYPIRGCTLDVSIADTMVVSTNAVVVVTTQIKSDLCATDQWGYFVRVQTQIGE